MLVAVTNGDNETFQSLLNEDGDNIHFKCGKYEASLLHFAAWKGNFSLVEFLVSKGIHASVKDNRGTTPLHWVSSVDSSTSDQAKIVQQLLLDNGVDIEEKCNVGHTALHQAASCGSTDTVQFLLSRGANANAKGNSSGFTPLHGASQYSNEENALLLLDHGADVSARDAGGATVLDDAATDTMKNIILTHKFHMMSRENNALRQEVQELRQDHQDLRNFVFAVFGNMDRGSTTTTTSDKVYTLGSTPSLRIYQ
jgi:ankyrin repeat protein